jgi:uncharacterized membrane protein
MQAGRKTLFLIFVPTMFFLALAVAILIQLDKKSDVVGYTVVVLICLYAFSYSASWLYVMCMPDK